MSIIDQRKIMACENHKHLAMIIKNTHTSLRDDSQKLGPEEAWSRHIAQTQKLQEYATSMQKLATTYWDLNNKISNGNVRCRIEWIKHQCFEYFLKEGKRKFHQREIEIISKLSSFKPVEKLETSLPWKEDNFSKINLLDIGSCYNPFANDINFNVTAIDLVPYDDKVLQCDFLNVKLGVKTVISEDKTRIVELGKNSFDVCVFSLLLEYFPCPKQRFLCCEKAYELLKNSGLLIIITPDSKHVNANAKIMKSWRYVLANLGFMRITYEKLKHLHCITFRKCINKDTAVRWITLQNIPKNDILFSSYSNIYIPQDFHSLESNESESEENKFEQHDLVNYFDTLPFATDIL
ncbi:S-adenosylmethionine sensor upstream of mTORC1 [Chelonus insularis]|uniref:S-adenosylmethionine sensor upstream of mTORC1 n=1 Tax=Chelonus insularis TaxID=460826 RepID=UPI00158E11CE|nr:S-adenosylmethionine sensor upstream of mTORC1 [Chelonus insularis]